MLFKEIKSWYSLLWSASVFVSLIPHKLQSNYTSVDTHGYNLAGDVRDKLSLLHGPPYAPYFLTAALHSIRVQWQDCLQ